MLLIKTKTGKILQAKTYSIVDGVSKVKDINGVEYTIGVDATLLVSEDSDYVYGQEYYFFKNGKINIGSFVFSNHLGHHFESENVIITLNDNDFISEEINDLYPAYLKKYEDSRSYSYDSIGFQNIKLGKRAFVFLKGRVQKFNVVMKSPELSSITLNNKRGEVICYGTNNFDVIQNNPKDFLNF